jgi:SAM-dependent methyltransferase
LSPPLRTPEYNVLARYFDLINAKYVPYTRQCDFLEAIFRRVGKNVHAILDLACGTGLHAFDLTRRGYRVVGVDRSPEMLAEAARKLAPGGSDDPPVTFLNTDMRNLPFVGEFDAAFAFNYPVAYLYTHADIRAGFSGVSRALKPGGLFLFDFISNYNPEPATQEETAENEEVRMDCTREFSYDYLRQVLLERNIYTVSDKRSGERRIIQGFDEFRFYYPQELTYYLEQMGGFRVLGFYRRWDVEAEANRSDMVVVCERGAI